MIRGLPVVARAERAGHLDHVFPTDLYYEPNWPLGVLHFWPVPNTNYGLELTYRVVLPEFQMTTVFSMPPGYRKALTLTLAEDVAGPLGATALSSFQKTVEKAMDARNQIGINNDFVPSLTTQDSGMPNNRGFRSNFNYRTGRWNMPPAERVAMIAIGGLRLPLLGAETASGAVSVPVNMLGYQNMSIYVTGTGTTSSGVVTIETADINPALLDAGYTGTWSPITTVNASDVSGGKQKVVTVSGIAYCSQARTWIHDHHRGRGHDQHRVGGIVSNAAVFVNTAATTVTVSTGLAGDGSGGNPLTIADPLTVGTFTATTTTATTANATNVVASGDVKAATFHVGATAGIDTTVTTSSLVGKTLTISKGVVTGFA